MGRLETLGVARPEFYSPPLGDSGAERQVGGSEPLMRAEELPPESPQREIGIRFPAKFLKVARLPNSSTANE